MKIIQNKFSTCYILLFLLILPLYTENAYFDIIEAKYKAFVFISLIGILPSVAFLIIHLIRSHHTKALSFDVVDIGVMCFAVVSVVSCFLSENVSASFIGYNGWYIGTFTILILTVLYFFFSSCYEYDDNIWIPIFAVNTIIFVIGIFQFAGQDVLGYTENILQKQYFQYISTFGNTNWYAGYLCLLLPIALVFFLTAKTRFSYWVNLIFLSLGIFNLLISISDGGYLGLGACAFFAIPYICRSMERIKRTLTITVIYSIEAMVIYLLPCYDELMSKASGVSAAVLDIRVSLGALFVSAILLLAAGKTKNEALFGKALCIIFLILLSLGAAAALVYTAINFSDKWGSSRGLIWRVSFEKFSDYGVMQKLFGIGPELLMDQYTEVQLKFENLAVLSSHSEPIQILLTTGIFGMLSYLSVISAVVIKFIKKNRLADGENGHITAFFLSLTAYVGQSLVNSATIPNLCLLCIIFSFFIKECTYQHKTKRRVKNEYV